MSARSRLPSAPALLLALALAACGARAAPSTTPSDLAASARSSETERDGASEAEPELHVPIRSVVELEVMSFNLRYGTSPDGEDHWDRRRELVIEVIRAERPDVLALQEDALFQVEQLLDALPEYAAIGVGSTDGREAGELVAILYRPERLRVLARGVFWLSETPRVPGSRGWGSSHARVCTWAVLADRATDQELVVYGTHLDHRSADARAHGLAQIAEHVRAHAGDRPVIVVGDLNLGPDDPALVQFLADTGLVDTYRAAHPAPEPGEGTYHAFRGGTDGPRVDFVLAGRGFRTRAAEIVRTRSAEGRYPSDHYPITTTIRIPRAH